jgi:hypothetical protein
MKIKVHMLAFGAPNEFRYVDVAEPSENTNELLEQVFHFGQNDFQPQQHPSVSVGDVVELEGPKYYLCRGVGFKELSLVELIHYRALERSERVISTIME